ncbi:Isochorismatase hydrolase [Penicillium alfredii]|uniref:Isochorismatase hydrolase n=1 Tax=Penicillium alfredii TaxID=1506179 RepID=A0A9W9FK65_9EURO|nr:Isochorismatase hydrolase [Penicillium alfredii]KAJ5101599.1 Isochorismatase hydrolase [Penicillium alfredii]
MADFPSFDAANKSNPGHYGPCQTALLLLDFHTLFVERNGGPRARAALEVAAKLRTWAKSQDIQVIHGLIDLGGGEESAVLRENQDDNEVTFTRTPGHVSALRSPGLERFLHEKGIKSLILTGLSTSGCVLRTALAACDAEYVVSVISDGCADPQEDVHDILINKVLSNRGYVTTAAQFQEGFSNAASSN